MGLAPQCGTRAHAPCGSQPEGLHGLSVRGWPYLRSEPGHQEVEEMHPVSKPPER